MSEIIPAILPKDFEDLREKLELVEGIVPLIHIDVTDGTLTPHANWPYGKDQFDENEESNLSYFEDVNFDVHLMLVDPLSVAEDWIRAGAHGLIIHRESFGDNDELSLALKVLRGRFDESVSFIAPEIGLAINLETPLSFIAAHVQNVDYIHLMSIAEIGQQGSVFESGVFERIQELQTEFPDIIISVDGGIGTDNAQSLLEVGVDKLIVGSEIFAAEDPTEVLEELLEIKNAYND